MMHPLLLIHLMILLSSYTHFTGISASNHQHIRVLKVGEELWKETLPLQMGSALYELHGLEPFKWYEVKISYPASIPASFSLRLRRYALDSGLARLRKLLNTEKLIFQNDNLDNDGPLYVSLTVMAEGVVAIPNVKEREFIIFNIVCDELLLGIAQKAWRTSPALLSPRPNGSTLSSTILATEQSGCYPTTSHQEFMNSSFWSILFPYVIQLSGSSYMYTRDVNGKCL